LWLRASGALERGYALRAKPYEQRVALNRQALHSVDGLEQPFTLDIVMRGSIIDVCIDGRRCLVDRCPEQHGDRLALYVRNGRVAFEDLFVRPLL
jgi:hypothetical protein